MDNPATNPPVLSGQEPIVSTPVKTSKKPSQKDLQSAAAEVVLGMESPKESTPTGPLTKPKWALKFDVFLCRAYVNVFKDSCKGNGQKGDVFWGNVLIKFKTLCGENPSTFAWELVPLKNRFSRHIQPACSQFVTFLRAAKEHEQSGWTITDYLNQANILWMREMKSHSGSRNAWLF